MAEQGKFQHIPAKHFVSSLNIQKFGQKFFDDNNKLTY